MKQSFILITLLFSISLSLFGCGSSAEDIITTDNTNLSAAETTLEEATDQELSDYPITISHAFGETIISEKPERIVTISWGNHDVPLALGILPVGISEANYGVTDGSGMLPWTAAAFSALGEESPNLFRDTNGLDFEAISDANPDIILAAYSGITDEEYALLSEIAPVVAYPTSAWETLWREQILFDAKGMGMEAEGIELVSKLETYIQDRVTLYPSLQGKTAAFCYFSPTDLSSFYIYLPVDPRAAFLTDLGFSFSDNILTLSEENTGFAVMISSENAEILNDVDVIIAYGEDSLLNAMQNDALLSTVPAIQNGAVALITDGTPLAAAATPSALSIPATLDEYLSIIEGAFNKINE